MNIENHRKYAMCDYNQNPSKNDEFKLGDVVINDISEIGVIIQCHGNDEYRADYFGNCSNSEIKKADLMLIVMHRPSLFN